MPELAFEQWLALWTFCAAPLLSAALWLAHEVLIAPVVDEDDRIVERDWPER